MARTLTAAKVAKPARPEGTEAEVQTLLRRLLQKVPRNPPPQ